MTITEFLLARIAEDEAVAKAATGDHWEWWNLEGVDQGWAGQGPDLQTVTDEFKPCPYPGCTWPPGDPNHRGTPQTWGHEHRATETVISAWGHDAWGVTVEAADADHIARHDPARVLAECEAKRRIVEIHGPKPNEDSTRDECATCYDDHHTWHSSVYIELVPYPCPTLRALSSVYADHPDYDKAWRP